MSSKNYRDQFPHWANRIEGADGRRHILERIVSDIADYCDNDRERMERCMCRFEGFLNDCRSETIRNCVGAVRKAYERWSMKNEDPQKCIRAYIQGKIDDGDLEELMDQIEQISSQDPHAARAVFGITANVLSQPQYSDQRPDLQERFAGALWRIPHVIARVTQTPASSRSSRPGQRHG